MSSKYPKIVDAIKNAPKVNVDKEDGSKYNFDLLPFGERGTYLSYEMVSEIIVGLQTEVERNFREFDYLLTTDPGSHVWAISLAEKLNKDVSIIRELSNQQPDEVEIMKQRAYLPVPIYLNHVKKGDRILIVEDVISSGGTLVSIVDKLLELDVQVAGVIAIYAKTDNYLEIADKYKLNILPLVTNGEI